MTEIQRPDFEHANTELWELHTFDCDRFQVYGYGTRNGECDCRERVTQLLIAFRDSE